MQSVAIYEIELDKIIQKSNQLSNLIYEVKRAEKVYDAIRNGINPKITVHVRVERDGGYDGFECIIEKWANAHINEAVNHTISETKKEIDKLLKEE